MEKDEKNGSHSVCVTGGTGFLATWIVMKLLQNCYSVNTTLRRNPGCKRDISYLTDLPGASERLHIFNADLDKPESFTEAIKGCIGVFHVAHPMEWNEKETEEVKSNRVISGLLGILQASLDSKTVKRFVYSSSVSSALFNNKELDVIDESTWTDLDFMRSLGLYGGSYVITKTLAERTALEFGEKHGLSVVTLLPTWIHGPFIGPRLPNSVRTSLALIFGDHESYKYLASSSFVHVEDVARAHIFLFEYPDAKGRYICSATEVTIDKLCELFSARYPEYQIPSPDSLKNITPVKFSGLSSRKLLETGFEYQYGLEEMFDGAIQSCKEKGLLFEMLQTSPGDSRSSWKVLIMDKVTVKVMSHSCKMADITDQGVSLVEDLFRRRQPLPSMDAIYFIQPSKENIVMFLSDMSGREPLYRKAYVYFSTPVPKDLISRIKGDTSVLPRIGALREMNLEYFSVDSQAFVTDHEMALEELFGETAANSRRFDVCLNVMATRIATVFASLKEFPFVRFKAAKGLDEATAASRDLVASKLAAAIWNIISTYKSSIPNFPQTETCELLILDRSVDQIAPVIHEWTYDAMCHDLLELDGNKYVHEIPSKTSGQPERKEVLLEDHDPVWLELRHSHIAEASERLAEKMTNFVSKNKAAQLQQRDGSELSTRDLQKMVQALPQYNEQMEKLSIHVAIAGKLNTIIRESNLRDLGQLEQDLVFGDAATKEVITYLRANSDGLRENKLRLMMIYASVYPEKFEGDKAVKLMQLAKLSPEDMKAVKNMKLIEGSETRKKAHGAFSLKFDSAKSKQAARKDRTNDEEETWALFRFYPMVEELIEKLNKGELPKDDYQCMNTPSPSENVSKRSNGSSHAPSATANPSPAGSVRSRRTATWAKSRSSDDGYSSDSALRIVSNEYKKMGQRMFVFIIGGATRSELRVCHKLSTKLKREVVLGTTSIDDPPQYITKLKILSDLAT